jgi:hypothetical protein
LDYVLFLKFINNGGKVSDTTYEYFIDETLFEELKNVPCYSTAIIADENGYNYRRAQVRLDKIKRLGLGFSSKATKSLAKVTIISRNQLMLPLFDKEEEPKTFGEIKIKPESITITAHNSMWSEKVKELSMIERKEETNMFDKMFKGFKFGMAEDVKLSIYGPAFRTKDNTYVAYNKDNELIEVDGLVLDSKKSMCYIMPVAKDDVAVGDFIYHNDSWTRVLGLTEDGYLRAEKINVKEVINIIPTKNVFGFDFYSKLVPLFGDFGFDVNEKNVFGNLPMLMALSEDKVEDMLPFFFMGNGGVDLMKNPAMLYFLMSKNSKGMDALAPLMFASMASMANKTNNKKGE